MTELYNIVVQQDENTVMTCYEARPAEQTAYQSEAVLEASFMAQLERQGYERVPIHSEAELTANLRRQLERLNNLTLSNDEWKRLFDRFIANENLTLEDKTERIQHDPVVSLELDNGETRNIRLLDKTDVYANRLQVMNQYSPTGGTAKNRYDVTILVNGLPLVHIELKRRGVQLKEAFNQINRYGRESFWADNGLFEYVQLFVISNGTNTKYYANTTRYAHCQEQQRQRRRVKTQGNSFEFTSYWADAENHVINDLRAFTETFFARGTLLHILTRYCVFTVDKNLLAMRPYQIAATERILQRIAYAHNKRLQGTRRAGGYIWHTTGSGKTLTSFKTAQLASRLDFVDKVLFVVDRKDLDYQTMKEYDNFEKDAANSNSSAKILQRQLNDPNCHIIITTIQKLSRLLSRQVELDCLDKDVVMIFDECHRSQFGDMQQLITQRFKRYYIFGFTGTPIFAVNASKNAKDKRRTTTAQVFGGEPDAEGKPTRPLHTYTIIDAINDKNVLRFKVDYVRTMRARQGMNDEQVAGIQTAEALEDPRYIANNVNYILTHFARKTKRNESYQLSVIGNVRQVVASRQRAAEERRKHMASGFNSIFAVDGTRKARLYYDEFARQQASLPEAQRLRVATIFTYALNESEEDGDLGRLEDENPEAVGRLDATSKEFLDRAIDDYNKMFGTRYSADGDQFANYYKDVSLRMKNKEIDLLIVVGMFLTGFDAKTLNTLWVDKNLKMHGLLQAFSRTNRILNSVKDCGNIVCFRNLEHEVEESFALFGNRDASGIILMRPFRDYYEGYDETDTTGATRHHEGYRELEERLLEEFPISSIGQVRTDDEKRRFVSLFGALLKLRNLLDAFDQFDPAAGCVRDDEGREVERLLLGDFQVQDYTSWYIDLREEFRNSERGEKAHVNDDIVFEMELVKQVQIDIAYILMLVAQYRESLCADRNIVVKIQKAVAASPDLRDKRELIEQFVARMTPDGASADGVYADWEAYVARQKEEELQHIIDDERLKPEETRQFVALAFEEGAVQAEGTAIVKILPPMPLFGGGGKRAEKKRTVIEKLQAFFAKYVNL